MNCKVCEDTGWKITDAGASPCRCRKLRIAKATAGTPLTAAAVAQAVEALGDTLSFFPKGIAGRTVIGDAIASMCKTVEQVRHMVRRAVALYTTWDKCGVPGLRQIVCSAGLPADGVMLSITEAFPEGVPLERPERPATLALPPGPQSEAVQQIAARVREIALARDIPTPEPDNDSISLFARDRLARLTKADERRALRHNIDKAALAELGDA